MEKIMTYVKWRMAILVLMLCFSIHLDAVHIETGALKLSINEVRLFEGLIRSLLYSFSQN